MVISDQNGNIFGVAESGELLHNRHQTADPTQPLLYPGTGRRIPAQLQDFRHWIAWPAPSGATADSAHFAFFRSDGTIHYNRIDRLGSATPSLAFPGLGSPIRGGVIVDIGSARRIFCDRAGTVRWLSAGALFEGPLTFEAGQPTLRPRARMPVPGWMSVLYFFSAGPSGFFSVDFAGTLRYHEQNWFGQLTSVDVATCWATPVAVFAAGDGGIYSITTEGELSYTRALVAGGNVSLTPPGYGVHVAEAVSPVCCPVTTPILDGYCWPLSAEPGETVEFKVSVINAPGQNAPVPYGVRYLRLRIPINPQANASSGDVESFEPEEMLVVQGVNQAAVESHAGEQWKDGCAWPTAFQLKIPANPSWRSGIYAAECCPVGADPVSKAWYTVFIVRPALGDRSVALAVLSNTNTWNAYNCWGGKSKYHCDDGKGLPQQLSFERPNPCSCPSEVQTRDCTTVRGMTAHLTRAELWVLTWLEDNGYSFHLYSDHDLDRGIDGASTGALWYKALILNTHPEYYTEKMLDNLQTYLDKGGNLIYLGGNGLYEQVEFASAGKVMKVLQKAAASDLKYCRAEDARTQTLWRTLGRPERNILGVDFSGIVPWKVNDTPYQVKDATHPFLGGIVDQKIGCAGLGGAASRWEMDVCQNPPSDVTLLARGMNDPMYPYGAHMVCRQDPTKPNFVFSVGSLGFGSSLILDGDLQRVLKNVLSQAGIAPMP